MIQKLSVKNFKSIKELEIDCRRINLFIGEPNTGKSNILEVLGLLSWCAHGTGSLKEYLRLQETQNLFYDNLFDKSVEIRIENSVEIGMKMKFEHSGFLLYLTVPFKISEDLAIESKLLFSIGLEFEGSLVDGSNIPERLLREFENKGVSLPDKATVSERFRGWLITDNRQTYSVGKEEDKLNIYEIRATLRKLDHSGLGGGSLLRDLAFIKFYRFKRQQEFKEDGSSFLMPPHGSNMFAVVMGNEKLRGIMRQFFRDFGFRPVLRTADRTFEIQKQIEDIVFSYPYISTSDTLQRMIFHTIAIESNENSTLVFEEPESHAFPSQTYQLGEKIASDEKNQYFIATHNPYLFLSILERAPKDEVNVFITYFEDYQTKVKCLNDEEKSKIMVYDPFANLDYFIGTLDSFVEEEEQ